MSDGTGPLTYLNVDGVEVGNGARTLSYLRKGLGNTMQGHWEVGSGDVCSVLYRLDGHGTCAVPAVFTSPAADPAPWYDPTEPGAATFLGMVLLDIDGYDSTVYRAITNRIASLGGATFSKKQRNPRTWKFRAAMVSADGAGAEYGLRWLTSVLQGAGCDDCATSSLTVRLLCPPTDCSNDNLGAWVSYDVALTAGPTEVEHYSPKSTDADADVLAGCRDYTIVEFTMTAGNPFMYRPPVACVDTVLAQELVCTDICQFLFGSAGTAICCAVGAPQRGVLGSIFTLESAYGFGELLLELYEPCSGSTGPTGTPVAQIAITEVPANGTVVVDSSQHLITVTAPDPVTGAPTTSDGYYLVADTEAPIPWLELESCDEGGCFCVRPAAPCTSGSVNVFIQTQTREG